MSIKGANLAVRFLLELCALAALGYWGFQTGRGPVVQVGLGLGVPLLAAIIWGMAVAPRATLQPPEAVRFILGLVILGLAVAALAAAGHPALAVAFAVIVAINALLLAAWKQ